MTRYAMTIDLDRCVGCEACVVACKAANTVPDPLWRLIVTEQAGLGRDAAVTFTHSQCFHCERPACTSVCPTGATYQDAKGVVQLDQVKCINCGDCVAACPYGARRYDEKLPAVQKCDFCPARLAAGLSPACVDVCPSQARHFGDLDQANSDAAQIVAGANVSQSQTQLRGGPGQTVANLTYSSAGAIPGASARVFRPELGLKPKLFYVSTDPKVADLSMAALPDRASAAMLAQIWGSVTRPLARLGPALAAAVTILAFPVAWRNARMHEKAVAAPAPAAAGREEASPYPRAAVSEAPRLAEASTPKATTVNAAGGEEGPHAIR
jgi:tetrathionate reductase subunit B